MVLFSRIIRNWPSRFGLYFNRKGDLLCNTQLSVCCIKFRRNYWNIGICIKIKINVKLH